MRTARKIFLEGLRTEKNCQAGFRKDFQIDGPPGEVVLRVTACTFYRAYLNGEFLSHGPARAAHGFARIDTIDLSGRLVSGRNSLAIEVAGYNEPTLHVTGEPSFLLAQLEGDGNVLLATDRSWAGIHLQQKRASAVAFSHARSITEIYDLDAGYFDWRTRPLDGTAGSSWFPVEEIGDDRQLIESGVEPPDVSLVGDARMLTVANVVGSAAGGSEKGVVEDPVRECVHDVEAPFRGTARTGTGTNGRFAELHVETSGDDTALTYDFGHVSSAFVGIELSVPDSTVVDLVHADRIGDDGSIDPKACASQCVVRLYCAPGHTRFESFEPYSVRYIRVIVRGARSFTLHDVFLRRFQYPDLEGGSFLSNDGELNRIYEAARLSLRVNTLDVFMDCPGRERGGWLCDSFWTARAAYVMFGDVRVERAMLENFLAPTVAAHFDGYLPAVYPAGKGVDLPNWTMYLILQLREYFHRTGDRGFLSRHEGRVDEIVAQLSRHESADGVLENLPGWIFVDGSTTPLPEYYHQPISLPTNLLYARMLECVNELYGRPGLQEKAGRIRNMLQEAHAGIRDDRPPECFADCLQRGEGGKLSRKKLVSEAAQYYAGWLDLASPADHPGLFKTLYEQYGPCPEHPTDNPRILRSDHFAAMPIRFELLAAHGEHRRLLREIRHLYGFMVDHGPGTLWESTTDVAGVDHGFASHAGVWLVRDFLGLGLPDAAAKTIEIAPHPSGLRWAKGSVTTDAGIASLGWSLGSRSFRLDATVPHGYRARLHLPEEVRAWGDVLLNGTRVADPREPVPGLGESFVVTARR
jgi:alpha-L-rhamnosidase